MKKRILLICLALVLVLTLALPATAAAKNNAWRPNAPTAFTGNGLIFVTYMPDPIVRGNIWLYYDEIVEGFLQYSDWEALAGTAFWSDHDSIVRVADDGTVWGIMSGSFAMARPDGSGVLSGSFMGRINGNLYTGDIYDSGTWRSTGGMGVFEGVSAWGSWNAELHAGLIPGTEIVSLVGPLTWEGKYNSPTSPVIKPWKWDYNISPGKPIKPWQPIKINKPWWQWLWPWG
jgi:hypothetical protein